MQRLVALSKWSVLIASGMLIALWFGWVLAKISVLVKVMKAMNVAQQTWCHWQIACDIVMSFTYVHLLMYFLVTKGVWNPVSEGENADLTTHPLTWTTWSSYYYPTGDISRCDTEVTDQARQGIRHASRENGLLFYAKLEHDHPMWSEP